MVEVWSKDDLRESCQSTSCYSHGSLGCDRVCDRVSPLYQGLNRVRSLLTITLNIYDVTTLRDLDGTGDLITIDRGYSFLIPIFVEHNIFYIHTSKENHDFPFTVKSIKNRRPMGH